MQRRGLLFILSSPSGAGKTTLCKNLLQAEKDIVLSVSVTTRPPRSTEKDGVDYFFLSPEKFKEMSDNEQLLEYATVHENGYGTPKDFVENALTKGLDILFDIDWQGTQQLRQSVPKDVVSIFIMPPSSAELRKRLTGRATDDPEIIEKRLAKAGSEITHWMEYDYVLINDDPLECTEKLRTILNAERMKRKRQIGLMNFIKEF